MSNEQNESIQDERRRQVEGELDSASEYTKARLAVNAYAAWQGHR
jgi:hypothetical protein